MIQDLECVELTIEESAAGDRIGPIEQTVIRIVAGLESAHFPERMQHVVLL